MKTKIDDKCNNPTAIIVTEKIKINYNLSTSIIITNFHFHKEFYLKQAIYCIIYEKILSLKNKYKTINTIITEDVGFAKFIKSKKNFTVRFNGSDI